MSTTHGGGVAFVTGAASGIGAACARRLATTHRAIFLADVAPIPDDLVTAIERSDSTAVPTHCNVSSESAVIDAVQAASQAGPLHTAVNAAGIGGPSVAVGDYELDAWRHVLDVDLTGVFLCIREEVRAMRLADIHGSIVTISSVLGVGASALAPAYTAAKHAVEGLTRSTALAYASSGIRINTVAPGFIDTELLRLRRTTTERTTLAAQHPAGRLGTVDEVAAAVAFLCSPEAGFITGSTYRVDGGFLTQS